jgi:AcrR family transcriptional regulator
MTLDAVIDAGCEIGLDRIEMVAVAERLGVGVGTLYRYVRDRQHLVALVAARCSRRARIVDVGQAWQDAVRESAAAVFDVYRASPQLVGHVMSGAVSDEAEIVIAEEFLALLVDRGFAPGDALTLYRIVQQIVIGAVVADGYRRVLEARHGDYAGMVRDVAEAEGDGALPHLTAAMRAGEEAAVGVYRPGLELVIAAYEARLDPKRSGRIPQTVG